MSQIRHLIFPGRILHSMCKSVSKIIDEKACHFLWDTPFNDLSNFTHSRGYVLLNTWHYAENKLISSLGFSWYLVKAVLLLYQALSKVWLWVRVEENICRLIKGRLPLKHAKCDTAASLPVIVGSVGEKWVNLATSSGRSMSQKLTKPMCLCNS